MHGRAATPRCRRYRLEVRGRMFLIDFVLFTAWLHLGWRSCPGRLRGAGSLRIPLGRWAHEGEDERSVLRGDIPRDSPSDLRPEPPSDSPAAPATYVLWWRTRYSYGRRDEDHLGYGF